jgi:hypothetical protein
VDRLRGQMRALSAINQRRGQYERPSRYAFLSTGRRPPAGDSRCGPWWPNGRHREGRFAETLSGRCKEIQALTGLLFNGTAPEILTDPDDPAMSAASTSWPSLGKRLQAWPCFR